MEFVVVDPSSTFLNGVVDPREEHAHWLRVQEVGHS